MSLIFIVVVFWLGKTMYKGEAPLHYIYAYTYQSP